jgi:hypothetical protein
VTALTERQLNRATLDRQLLLRREGLDAIAGVRRVMALQAQEPASPYIALWNRLADFDPAELDRAFADGAIVKATLMRMTLHAVAADDFPPLHALMVEALRTSVLRDDRFAALGLSAADADSLIPDVLAFVAQPRTNPEMHAFLVERLGIATKPGPWWALRRLAPVVHAPTGGPWSFGPRPSYAAADNVAERLPAEAAGQHLVRRYLQAFGPASVADIGQFSLRSRGIVRTAVEALGDELVRLEGPAGADLYDLRRATVPDERTVAPPRLLPMWDSVLLAYKDRSRIIPPDYRGRIIHQNGDVLPSVLVDGFVAGVWRPVDRAIEVTAFHELDTDAWRDLAGEASRLLAFLAPREPMVFRRYGHWWKGLSSAEVRILPG